jgi:hypothetical protein
MRAELGPSDEALVVFDLFGRVEVTGLVEATQQS